METCEFCDKKKSCVECPTCKAIVCPRCMTSLGCPSCHVAASEQLSDVYPADEDATNQT
jgi:hypothetical protein